jgi:hypothetical protein
MNKVSKPTTDNTPYLIAGAFIAIGAVLLVLVFLWSRMQGRKEEGSTETDGTAAKPTKALKGKKAKRNKAGRHMDAEQEPEDDME